MTGLRIKTTYDPIGDVPWDDEKVKEVLRVLVVDYANMMVDVDAILDTFPRAEANNITSMLDEFGAIMQDPLGEDLRYCESCGRVGFVADNDIDDWVADESGPETCPDCVEGLNLYAEATSQYNITTKTDIHGYGGKYVWIEYDSISWVCNHQWVTMQYQSMPPIPYERRCTLCGLVQKAELK